MKFRFLILILCVPAIVFADELETVRVQGDSPSRNLERVKKLKDATQAIETISQKKIEKKQAKTLGEAIDNESGVSSQIGDSICGSRRVQINGLKGEYTSVLIDGVPLNSTVSSFYGFDAYTTAGIAEIEISRGAGMSLFAPEGLGGTINVITKRATENSAFADLAFGNAGYRTLNGTATGIDSDGKRRLTLSAQNSNQAQWDTDGNGVSESPTRENNSILIRYSEDLNDKTSVDLRVTHLKADTQGGYTDAGSFATSLQPGVVGFDGNDVRKRYTGSPGATSESVHVTRTEAAAKITQHADSTTTLTSNLSAAEQSQDSLYEGNDYANRNQTVYGNVFVKKEIFLDHLVTFGIDYRFENLRSESYKYFTVLGVGRDNFDNHSGGVFLEDLWNISDRLEALVSVRVNHVWLNFIDQKKDGNFSFAKPAVSPKLALKYKHSSIFVSRLSLSQGFRTPLSFFESEHGILDTGFDVVITDLERAQSAIYTLEANDQNLSSSFSAAYTQIQNMSFINTRDFARPRLMNSNGVSSVWSIDASVGYQVTRELSLGLAGEQYFFSQGYKGQLPVAAIENRYRFLLDLDAMGWDLTSTLVLIGPRDLAPFGYGDRYNVYTGAPGTGTPSSLKSTAAPAFFTLDLKAERKISSALNFYIGVKNLFDYTQTRTDSPLFFDGAGSYDVLHIWGPMRGRQIYAGLSAKL